VGPEAGRGEGRQMKTARRITSAQPKLKIPQPAQGGHDRRHDFESIGEILSRLRLDRCALEARMRPTFDPALSLLLDDVLQREQTILDERLQ
jgi:hypothetical protein